MAGSFSSLHLPRNALEVVSYDVIAASGSPRPVVFFSGSGPVSAASGILNVGGFGPERLSRHELNHPRLITNPHSPFDCADLVFYDPPATGFSPAERAFASTDRDVEAFVEFVQLWLATNGRTEASVAFVGESYGSLRVISAVRQILDAETPIDVKGVLLLSQWLNLPTVIPTPDSVLSYVVSFSSFVVAAHHHGRGILAGTSTTDAIQRGESFARERLLPALFEGSLIDAKRRDELAFEAARLTGTQIELWRRHELRVTRDDFVQAMLEDQGELIYAFDSRVAGAPAIVRTGIDDDDSFADLKRRFQSSEPSGAGDQLDALVSAGSRLAARSAGAHTETYRIYPQPVEGKGAEAWKWSGGSPFDPWPYPEEVCASLNASDRIEFVLAAGIYDLSIPIGASILAASQLSRGTGRVRVMPVPSGKLSYCDDEALSPMADLIRRWLHRSVDEEQ